MAVLAALAGCSTPDGGVADAPQTGWMACRRWPTLAPTAQARATPAPVAAPAQPCAPRRRRAPWARQARRAAVGAGRVRAKDQRYPAPASRRASPPPRAGRRAAELRRRRHSRRAARAGQFTGKQFLVDPRVKGTLTLVSQGPVAPDAAYSMLLGALRMQGYAAVDVAGGTGDAGSRRQAAGRAGAKRRRAGGRRRGHADLPPELRERDRAGACAAPDDRAQQQHHGLSGQQHAGHHRLC